MIRRKKRKKVLKLSPIIHWWGTKTSRPKQRFQLVQFPHSPSCPPKAMPWQLLCWKATPHVSQTPPLTDKFKPIKRKKVFCPETLIRGNFSWIHWTTMQLSKDWVCSGVQFIVFNSKLQIRSVPVIPVSDRRYLNVARSFFFLFSFPLSTIW